MVNSINEEVKTRKCTGCGACVAICPVNCIKMEVREGFYYPVIDTEKCIDCGKCRKVCSTIKDNTIMNKGNDWLMAYAEEKYMPRNSTSGGICTIISKWYLENGFSVYAACFNQDWEVVHCRIKDLDELEKFAGSKYSQSIIEKKVFLDIKRELLENRKVLFIGTPCQVAGLKRFVSENAVKNKELLCTIDFICHGIPSPILVKEFIRFLSNKKKIVEYNFRSKDKGWGKMRRSVTYSDGKIKSVTTASCPLHSWFGQHLSIRESCFDCNYRTEERASDITVADFWGVKKYYPEQIYEQGLSSVQVNTAQGEKLIDLISNNINVVIKPISYESVWDRKTALSNYKKPDNYYDFWEYALDNDIKNIIKQYPAKTYIGLVKEKLLSMIRK